MDDPLPPSVRTAVEEELNSIGLSSGIVAASPVGGGCIHHATRLDTGEGERFFLKWNARMPRDMFEAEADGLEGLRAAAAPLKIPEPIACGGGGGGRGEEPAWLLMEYVPRGRAGPGYAGALGRGLALLHASATGEVGGRPATATEGFGWRRDNFIGSLPQSNRPTASWIDFWRERRLAPQWRLARQAGYLTGTAGEAVEALIERLDEGLEGEDAGDPDLLHGDLWSGNAYPGPAGEPVILDPAVYRGRGEVDLAMTELFGGFPPAFHHAYQELRPSRPGYATIRRHVYQLYYLLVHVNLFGGAYEASAVRAARGALQGLAGG